MCETVAENENYTKWDSVGYQLEEVTFFEIGCIFGGLVDVNFFDEEGCHCGDEKQNHSPKKLVLGFALSHTNFGTGKS